MHMYVCTWQQKVGSFVYENPLFDFLKAKSHHFMDQNIPKNYLKDTIFQITRSKMEYYIQQVDQIHEVVQAKPDEQSFPSNFRKTIRKGKKEIHIFK